MQVPPGPMGPTCNFVGPSQVPLKFGPDVLMMHSGGTYEGPIRPWVGGT